MIQILEKGTAFIVTIEDPAKEELQLIQQIRAVVEKKNAPQTKNLYSNFNVEQEKRQMSLFEEVSTKPVYKEETDLPSFLDFS